MKTEENTVVLEEEILLLKEKLSKALEQIEWLKKQLFGRKSERVIAGNSSNQLLFSFYEETPIESPKEEKIIVPSHEKRKPKTVTGNSITYPDNLPVVEVVLDLPEEDKISEEGASLVCIGEDVSNKLARQNAYFFIKRTIRKKYALAAKPEEGIKSADLPESLIPRSSVDESIIADVLVKKFCDHLPLYRQSEIMARDDVKISRQTLSSYVIASGKALKPLYDLLEKEIKYSENIFVDETPVDMLAPGTGKTSQAYMVTLVGGKSLDPPLRVYKFFTSRKHEGFKEIFQDYLGVFHSDKYSAYEKEAKEAGKIWQPCFAHIRRKYFEAEGDLKFREEVIEEIRKLFEIEERAKNVSPEERVLLRKSEAAPIIDALIEKNKKRLQERILPKSKLSNAIGYFLSLSPYLKNYIEHPFARPDNNVAERALKHVVIGRKNWLFVGNEGGGEASSIIFSLAQTCRALGINPYTYFEDVLRRIQSHPYNKLVELLPQNWKPISS